MSALVIAAGLLARVVEHCRHEWPLEACGLLAVDGGRVVEAWSGTNVLQSPVRFRMADDEVARWMWEIEMTRDCEAAAYHSHPRGPARFSASDLAEAGCRLNVLVSLADRARPVVRVFRVEDGQVFEDDLRVEPDTSAQVA
jgi:proteasome lid subunit RPN8/RPN11